MPQRVDDEILIEMALANIRQALTPLQLYWLSVRMCQVQERSFGELTITWRNGHVHTMFAGNADKMDVLKMPELD